MSDLSLPETPMSPPPGIAARVLTGAPSVHRLLADVPDGVDDIVDPGFLGATLAQQPLIEHRWSGEDGDDEAVTFPLVTTSASLLGAIFSVPLEQAWALLPATERLVPVRVTPRRAAISFFAWEVRRGSLGTYREVGAALPVLLDAPRVPPPGPPSAWRRDPSLGLYAFELPVDSERAAQVGRALMGLPHVTGTAEMAIDPHGGHVSFAHEDAGMLAQFDVRLNRWASQRRLDLSFQAYSLLGGRIVRTRYSAIGDGYRGRRGHASVTFGEHRRAQRLRRLDLSRRALEMRVVPRVNWFAAPSEDAGSI
jgi:hypothetical protein